MVTVYTDPGCQPCKATKRELKKKNIAFQEVDVEKHPEERETVRRLGFTQLPVVVSEGDAWSGFSPDKIATLSPVALGSGGE